MEMQMLSEVGINRHIYPIIQKRGRIFEGNYIRKDSYGQIVFEATEDSRWNLRCYKFMDYISSRLRKRFDEHHCMLNPNKGIIKTSNDARLCHFSLLTKPGLIKDIIYYLQNPSEMTYDFTDTDKRFLVGPYTWNPEINIKEVAKDLKWSKNVVIQIIKMIANYKFKTEYNFKTSKSKGNFSECNFATFYKSDDFEPMFNCVFDSNYEKCNLLFDTGYGVCFIHNIYTGGYQIFEPEELYGLSESAQFIYRKRFFTYSKLWSTKLSIHYVMNFLGVNNKDKSEEKKLFKKIIKEIVEKTKVKLESKNSKLCYTLSLGMELSKEDKELIDKLSSNESLFGGMGETF